MSRTWSLASLTLLTLATSCRGGELDGSAPAADPDAPITLTSADATVVIGVAPFSLEIRRPSGEALLSSFERPGEPFAALAGTHDEPFYAARSLPGWDGYEAGEAPWRHATRARVVTRRQGAVTLAVEGPDVAADVEVEVAGPRVKLRVATRERDGKTPLDKATLAFSSPPDEHFFGMGERFAASDHRGFSLYSYAEEGGLAGGEAATPAKTKPFPNGPSMTYFPVPFFLSTRGYGVHLATTYRTELHFASEGQEAWRAAVNAGHLDLTVYVADDPLKTLDRFTEDTGRPLVPSPWVFGLRRRVGVDAKVGDELEHVLMRKKKIPCTGIDDAVHFLPALSQLGREDALRQWTTGLHALGYKAFAYNNPYIASGEPSAAADFAHGKAQGLFIKGPDGQPALTTFISGKLLTLATIDLTNPAAVSWFQELLRRTLALGYDGWMHDFGEYVPRDAVLFDGRRGDEFHNAFPVLSAKAAHELMEKERPGDYLFFVRSGGAGTQRYAPAVWGGDAEATFDDTQGLPSAVRSGVSLSMSGVPYWGSDMTGFKCLTPDARDKDVFLRWVQVGAVSPIMMEQNACANPVSPGKTKWSLWNDDETIDVYRRWASLHTRLQPYFLVLAREASETGAPLMRHPFLVHPREPSAWAVDDAFWLGDALYAAPVVRRARTERSVWLPPGDFVDLDDGERYVGGATVTVPAPLAKLPLFLAANRLLPLLDASIDTLAPATDPSVVTPERVADRLDVVVALSPSGEATRTLADGTTLTARRVPDAGNPAGLTEVADAAFAGCASCYVSSTRAGLARTRVTGALAASSDVTFGQLRLTATGPRARRVRWDVTHLP